MLGKLSWAAIPFDQPIPLVAAGVVGLVIAGVLVFITLKGWLPYLWREWITSVDHKRIGVMYVVLAMVMLLRGFTDAIMMRSQQALAFQAPGYLPPEHYDQIFSAHGTLMIFFVAMPFVIGLMNFVVPLQLGVRDVAFPTLNSVSFWLTATGALLVNISLVVGEFARTGWLPYPPLSELTYSPGVGVDYYLWSLQISGVGTLLTGVNFVTTILKIHAPGMTYMRMPMFCWTALASNLLIVAAFPILTATFAMLLLDRYLGFHFFTNEAGGNVMMFMNLIWAWGHPEVYILVLPAFGVFSEVVSTFSGKPLFGYRSMVAATMAICILAFMVWLHHFFTMGAGADVNAIFGIATMIIAVPTGVKVFNWLFTMYGGRIVFATPMLWSIGFMVTFVLGGMTGVLLAVPPADFVLHNSLFLVAHFHNVIIGGVLFGAFAGYTYWFPKAFGFRLHEGLGKAAFWCWFIGFYLAFMPLYVLGLMGMTRRMQHYDVPAWHPWLLVAAAGAAVILAGIVLQIAQLAVSIRQREQLRDVTGDPWNGRSLEWSTASPPPAFNFAVLPQVEGGDAYWRIKQRDRSSQTLRRAALRGHRDAAEQPDRLHLRLLRDLHGLRADLAYLVAGCAWPSSAPSRHSSCSPGATEPRIVIPADEVARIDRANRVPATRRSPGCRPARMSAAHGNRIGGTCTRAPGPRRPSASSSATASGSSCSATSSCSRRSSRPTRCCRTRPPAARAGRTCSISTSWRSRRHACCCRASPAASPASAPERAQRSDVLWRDGGDRRARRGVPAARGCASSPAWSPGRGADAQRLPVGVLHAGRLPRAARHAGLLWLLTMMAQVFAKGYRADILRRVLCFSLFWHTLDIIWVALFTVVYLMGAGQ